MFMFVASYLRPGHIKYYPVSTTVFCDSLETYNLTVLVESKRWSLVSESITFLHVYDKDNLFSLHISPEMELSTSCPYLKDTTSFAALPNVWQVQKQLKIFFPMSITCTLLCKTHSCFEVYPI